MAEVLARKPIRCAIYTRKSSEEGLEQAFNSLQAQREACDAYINSQRHEGWSVIPTLYDDGGFSGGTMDRPALRTLLADIGDRKVDIVVVYKIDRLTRSLFDFAKMVEIFDATQISFVSVTQAFNTTTSMGRLTLNVLLSFAQFEREVTGERIRDKVAASKKKGMWMGGNIPLGYDLQGRKLAINESEAKTVRLIFELYDASGAVRGVKSELDRLGKRTKLRPGAQSKRLQGGSSFHIGHLYTVLRNPLYIGRVHHRGQLYDGEHPAIIELVLWQRVQDRLKQNAVERRLGQSSQHPSLLAGLLYDRTDMRMTPTHSVKRGRRYRYYTSSGLIRETGAGRGAGFRLSGQQLEDQVVAAICRFLGSENQFLESIGSGINPPTKIVDLLYRGSKLRQMLLTDANSLRHQTLRRLIRRVQINAGSIQIALDRNALKKEVSIEEPDGSLSEVVADPIVLNVSAELKELGQERHLIISADSPANNRDPILIKALTRAHHWFELLKQGQVNSMAEIARQEKLARSYVSTLLPLAFLAPDITQAVFAGRQPVDLNLDRLLHLSLPLEWVAQRKALGFVSG